MNQALTFNQLCLFILTVAAVVLVVQLVQTLTQFRRSLSKADEALAELRSTLADLRQIAAMVRARAESVSAVIEGFERSTGKLAAVMEQVASYILKPFLLVGSVLGGLKTAMALIGRRKSGGNEDVGEQGSDGD